MGQFYDLLGEKKSRGICLAVINVWKPYRNATTARAPQAAVLFDKFHILRHLGEALKQVRKAEYARLTGKDRRFIKGQKYTLLSHRENLTLEGRRSLKLLLAANKRLNTAYLLKESFGQLWSYPLRALGAAILREPALEPEVAAPRALREVRPDDRASLGWNRRLLQAGEQGLARFRRAPKQQDPRHPAPCIRPARRGIPAAQDPHLHAASALKCLRITNSSS